MAGPALGHIRVLATVAECTGKCLVLGLCFLHLGTDVFMTGDTESPRCGHRRVDLQRMMCLMAGKTVTGHLAFDMGFMTGGTVRDLAMDLVAEGAG